jgi:hypothetical protein
MYNPQLGRFMQIDPIGYGDGMNLYGYVGGDPVNLRDSMGLSGAENPEPPIVVEGCRPGTVRLVNVCVPDNKDLLESLRIGTSTFTFTTPGAPIIEPNVDCTANGNVVTCALPQPVDQCRDGNRLALGLGYSGTLFTGIIGGSLGSGFQMSVPFSSLKNGSLRGTQFTFSGYGNILGGVGLFAGLGVNIAGGLASTAPEGVDFTNGPVMQLGAGDGGGVEVTGNLGENAGIFSGSGGPRGALGLYGAVGNQFAVNYSTPPIGC